MQLLTIEVPKHAHLVFTVYAAPIAMFLLVMTSYVVIRYIDYLAGLAKEETTRL